MLPGQDKEIEVGSAGNGRGEIKKEIEKMDQRQLVLKMEIQKCLGGLGMVRRVCGEKLGCMAR